jgi:3-phosphoshikimate 1-carboxyvinyltransferase
VTEVTVEAVEAVNGDLSVPGDKSMSHRALILGALAQGKSRISNLSPADDVARTADCLRACGASIGRIEEHALILAGRGPGRSLAPPATVLDCGNSGTTARLLAGALAGHELTARLDGDASLRRRPMRRVAEPLETMGASLRTTGSGTLPLTLKGHSRLRAIDYRMPVASAQVKSAVLLAALSADGRTSVEEPAQTRDHTERMLRMCGVPVSVAEGRVEIEPADLAPFDLEIPGDTSSAAFFLALAASRTGWRVRCRRLTLNPGRTGVLDVLIAMGAQVEVSVLQPAGGVEPQGDVEVCGTDLVAATIGGGLVARCIDELPVLAVVATQAAGETVIRDAAELRNKESDRIAAVAAGLAAMGADCRAFEDGMAIRGPTRLRAATLDSSGDHRLAMAWAVAGLLADRASGKTRICGAECVSVSYPGFFADLRRLT